MKTCPNCCQLYHIKLQQPSKSNLPLFLSCGHSMCQSCITNIVKFLEPIECKVCLKNMELNPEDVVNLNEHRIRIYELFPINVEMVGELTMDILEKPPISQTAEKQYYIDLQAIMKGGSGTKGTCIECRIRTGKMCEQCNKALCENCFNKSHKTFVIFQNHVLQDIDAVMITNNCGLHISRPLDYYCHDCKKSICMDCLMVGGDKSCKNHNVVAMQEVNETFIEELGGITPKVNEIFKRLTKTSVDIGNLLYRIDNESGSASELPQIISNIEQHFSKLCSVIQKHKQDVMGIITKLQCAEKESLLKAQNDVYNALKNAKKVIDTINMTADEKKLKQMNLALLLNDAKQILDTPWYLNHDESKEHPLKVVVNEDLCALISDYIHLEGNAKSVYKLSSTTDLGSEFEIPPAPVVAVYPPELVKDVRQQPPKEATKSRKPKEEGQALKAPTFYKFAPQYRSKSVSNNSLNSISSDSSARSYIQGDGYHKPIVQPVQPFKESQHPKQLKEGTQELIYISHIVDPHEFYVQRACHQKLVKELMREFRNAVSLPKPSANHITEGKTYLAYNNVDDMWCRCRIISIERKNDSNTKYNVFYFDFGSTGIVSIDKLRLIPPARLQSPYPLAYNCSLANCEPITGAWKTDDALLIQKIIDNKQAVIHIRRIQATSNYTMKLECDLTTFEDGVSVAHALVFHGRAKLINPKLMYLLPPGVKDRPKIFVNNSDYKPKMIEEVYLTHIVNPDKFYVRKRHAQKLYEKMCEDLEAEYSLEDKNGKVYLPEIGMVCAVNVEQYVPSGETCRWARAKLTKLSGRGLVHALLLDSGLELHVHWTKLRHIASKFTTCRALATECHLAGITALKKRWSTGSVALLQKYENVLLELHVEDNQTGNRNSLGVTLYDKSDEENIVCLNQLMIKYKFAVSIGMFDFKEKMVSDTQDLVVTNKPSLEKPNRTTPKPKIEILKRSQKVNVKDLEAKDKGPLRLEAKLLQYQSPSLIYIALVHQQKTFNELFEKMQIYYSNKNNVSTKSEWRAGDRCCTVCFQSQTWRRATIVEIEGTNAKVFYSDFACVETVPLQKLVELAPEFASIGDAAIKCHLSGVVPAVGDQWPSLTKEVLKELLDAYNRIFITKIGNFKDKSMPVEIWVYHTEQGGALEPNRCEWRCLNKKIVEQGLGIPDKSLMVEEARHNVEGNEEMLSFLNVTGSVQEWLLLEPLALKPLPKKPSPVKESSPMSTSEHDLEENESQDVMVISDWLPPEPFQSKEFTAMPTYIDHDGVIYLHDVAQQDTLDLIRKALDVKFKHPDPKAKYIKWNVGEPCIALYFLDQRFYRGRIVEVDENASTCLIHYIDYGNDELCSFENIRKSIALHQIPTQAHKCVLDRIKPVDKHWDRQTLDYLHKAVVEKQCYVKVTGEPVEGITPIELKYDKLLINNHLVEFEMAKFTDGSTAPLNKFAPTTSKQKYQEEIQVETDSGPDFIVDEEDDTFEDSQSFTAIKGRDWNEMLENDNSSDETSSKDVFLAYPNEVKDEFSCNISQINCIETVELSILHDEDTNNLYEEMFQEIEEEGSLKPLLTNIFENKPCIARFSADQQWYRALIKQYSEARNQIRVRYVDYGNEEIISVSDAREIDPEWVKLPPATITAKLHGLKCNKDVDIKVLMDGLGETFLDKDPFTAKVIEKKDNIVNVELTDANNEIVYKHLIDKGLLLVEN